MGIPSVCPPLAKRSDFKDGTHNLKDCLEMHLVMEEMKKAHSQAMSNAR